MKGARPAEQGTGERLLQTQLTVCWPALWPAA